MQEKSFKKKHIIADLVLIAATLLIALSAFLIVEAGRESGSYAEVLIDGGRVAKFALSEDGVHVLNGGTNTLVIEDGHAYVTGATCPDRTCEHTGRVSRVGERIICLPNKLEIRIVGDSDGILGV